MTPKEALEDFAVFAIGALVKNLPSEMTVVPALIEQALADYMAVRPELGAAPPDPEDTAIDARVDAELKADAVKI